MEGLEVWVLTGLMDNGRNGCDTVVRGVFPDQASAMEAGDMLLSGRLYGDEDYNVERFRMGSLLPGTP